MDLDAIRTFVDVVKHGSFAAVARRHDVDPSSVSRAIAALERELGFRLFQRTTRKLAPTEAGSAYFAQVEDLLDEFDRAGERALDLVQRPTGNLRVTACTSFGQRILAPLLPKLRSRHPGLTLDLVLADHKVDLVAEQIDLAVRFGLEPEGELIATKLVPRRFRVCASPAYLVTAGAVHAPHDLSERDCLLFPLPGYRTQWRFRRDGGPAVAVPVSGQLVISHGMTMTACAVAGLGPALLPDWLCDREIAEGALVDLFPDLEWAAAEFDTAAWLVYPSRAYVPLKLRAVIDFLKAEVGGFA